MNGEFIFNTIGRDKELLLSHYDGEVMITQINNADMLVSLKKICNLFDKLINGELYRVEE